MMDTTIDGAPLKAGWNVDAVCVDAGVGEAKRLGYSAPTTLTVVEYALSRHAKGEEELAMKTATAEDLDGVSLTCWYMILAAAIIKGGEQ